MCIISVIRYIFVSFFKEFELFMVFLMIGISWGIVNIVLVLECFSCLESLFENVYYFICK